MTRNIYTPPESLPSALIFVGGANPQTLTRSACPGPPRPARAGGSAFGNARSARESGLRWLCLICASGARRMCSGLAEKNEDPGAVLKRPGLAKKNEDPSGFSGASGVFPRGLNSLLSAQVALPSLGLGDLYGFFGRVEAFSARRQLLKSVLDQGVHASVVRFSSTSPVSLWVGQSCLFLLLRNRFSVRFAVASLAFADALPCFFGRQLHLLMVQIFFWMRVQKTCSRFQSHISFS